MVTAILILIGVLLLCMIVLEARHDAYRHKNGLVNLKDKENKQSKYMKAQGIIVALVILGLVMTLQFGWLVGVCTPLAHIGARAVIFDILYWLFKDGELKSLKFYKEHYWI